MAIQLICCIGVDPRITSPHLLGHFLAHYKKLGVQRFHFILNEPAPFSQFSVDYISRFDSSGLNISFESWLGKFCVFEKTDRINSFLDSAAPDTWTFICDFDEFHLPLRPLEDLLQADTDYYVSTLVDRIAYNGVLKEIIEQPSIEEQFPLATNVTEKYQFRIADGEHRKAKLSKVALVKGCVHVDKGHHFVHPEHESLISAHDCFVTNHYKWDSLLPNRLERRIAVYSQDPEKYHWYEQFVNLMKIVDNSSRINLEQLSLEIDRPSPASPA